MFIEFAVPRELRALRRLAVGIVVVAASACGSLRLRSPIATGATPSGPPQTFVPTTSDARMTRVLDVRDGLSKSAAFRAASDYLGQKYSIDVSDPRAGFLMTPWINNTRGGAPDLRYRTRIIVRFLGDDGRQVSVRNEANWQQGDEWEIGFDSQMLEDAVVELRSRIGKKS